MKRLEQGAVYLLFRLLLWFLGMAVAIPKLKPFLVWVMAEGIGYRKKVVMGNLALAFPSSSPEELTKMAAHFYGHFVHLLMQQPLGRKKSECEWIEAVRFDSDNLLEKYAERKVSCFVVMGHTGNWEWAGLRASLVKGLRMASVYKPQRNTFLNDFLVRERSKYGMEQVAMKDVVRYLQSASWPFCLTFIADQSGPKDSEFYPPFFGVKTSFFGGWAKIALRKNIPILYAGAQRHGNTAYSVHFKSIWDGTEIVDAHRLVEKFAAYLEEDIKGQPENWLWSHRRWKWTK